MSGEQFKRLGRTMADCDPNDLEIEPGLPVGSLVTRADCDRATHHSRGSRSSAS